MYLDPRCRILLLFLLGIATFIINTLTAQIIMMLALIGCAYLLHITPKKLLSTTRFLQLLLPLTFVLQVIFTLISNWQGWQETDWLAIFHTAFFYTFRIANLLLVMALAFNWLNALELLDAIYHWLQPLRRLHLPVDDLFQMIFIAIRFFPEVKVRFQQIQSCWQNFGPTAQSLTERLKLLREIIIPVMIVSFRKAEILSDAMTIRGYSNTNQRTYYGALHWTKRDSVVALVGLFLFAVVIM